MATIVTRATKGSALTWTEGDANITNLNNDKIESVVEDLTPQLGGDLDVNGNAIVSASNGNIEITPNGTGTIVLAGLSWPGLPPETAPAAGNVTASDEANYIYLDSMTGVNMGSFITFSGAGTTALGVVSASPYYISYASSENSNIQISQTMGGMTYDVNTVSSITDVTFSVSGGGGGSTPTTGALLTYGTGGTLSWNNPTPSSSSLTSLTDVFVSAPNDGEALVYDSMSMKWKNEAISSSGLANIVGDTTPQLGGDLDVNGNKIVSTSNGNIALEPNGTGKVTATTNIETSGDVKGKELFSTNSAGDEGGQINLAKPATGTTISGTGVIIDVYQNKLRIFEEGGSARGAYIDLTAAGTSVSTNLMSGGGISNVVEDTTPQLGGTLDANGNSIDMGTNDITDTKVGNWDTAYGWGNHASAGYLTTETYTGTVTSVGGTGTVNGLSLSGTVTSTGNLTLGGTLDLTTAPAIGSTSASTGKFTSLQFTNPVEPTYTLTYGATITPNATNGSVQKVTLTGNVTMSAFTSPVAGQSITVIFVQDATGSRTLTSTMKWAGGIKTLSTAANSIDIASIYYDGTNYYASLAKGFA